MLLLSLSSFFMFIRFFFFLQIIYVKCLLYALFSILESFFRGIFFHSPMASHSLSAIRSLYLFTKHTHSTNPEHMCTSAWIYVRKKRQIGRYPFFFSGIPSLFFSFCVLWRFLWRTILLDRVAWFYAFFFPENLFWVFFLSRSFFPLFPQ